MVGDDRPTAPPLASPTEEGDPFGGLRSGTQVGKYEIVETLGQGGFGITYRARDTQLRRDVAIKEYLPTSFAVRRGDTMVLPRSTQTAEDFLWGRERFLDEARTLARLEDAPGIVNVYDFMEANGTAYMVMALVRGETLEARLKRDRRLPQPAIEQLLYPLLDGLELVHGAGFLHRDIKPANILIDASGRPTLIDFGASRVALQGRTQTLTAVYTPGYAAFEQSTSARQGPWTDIYALAATLYHCITGAPPPAASDRMIDDRVVAAAETGKGRYAPSLLAAIDAGLKLKATERPQTIADWRRVLSGLGPGGGDSLGPATREMDEPATRRTAHDAPRKRAPVAWMVAGALALALAGGAAWLFLRSEPDTVEVAVRRAEAEAQRQASLAAKLRQEEEARQRAAAEARRKVEEESARKAAEEKAVADEAARRQATELERQRQAAAEARRLAEADAARKAAEEKAAAEAAARRQTEDAERQRQAAAEARRRADEEAARKVAGDKAAADAVARRKAEEEAAARAEADAARQRREDEIRRDAEARVRAEYEARRRADEAARATAEAEAAARRREEEARRVEAAAREKAEAEAKRKAEADSRQAADDKTRAEADAKRQAEAAEGALRLSETDRKRVQVALTALGHNTHGSDGSFGSRTRQMIAAWQKGQGAPETGYLTAPQFAALRQQAAPALARFDEDQKRVEEDKRKAEEEARKRAEEERRQQQKPAAAGPSVAAAPSTTSPATGVDGTWSGAMDCENGPKPKLTFQISGGSGRTNFTTRTGQGDISLRISGDSVSVQLSWPGREGNMLVGSMRGTVSGPRLTASGNSRIGSGAGGTFCSLALSR